MRINGTKLIAATVFAAAAILFLIVWLNEEKKVEAPPPISPLEAVDPVAVITPRPLLVPEKSDEKPSVLETIVEIVNPPPPPPQEPIPVVLTGETIRVNSGMILATVNGSAITLRDLMPVNTSVAKDTAMTADMYASLLDRAITRELAFQAAKTRQVELSEEQIQNLEKIRTRAIERDPNEFSNVHDDYLAKAEFDVRDFSGLMMQESLLAAAGGPPKYVTPEIVEKYYNEHKNEFAELPEDPAARQEAWQAIDVDIRLRLAPQLDGAYQQELQKMMDDLKQQANIKEFVSVTNR